MNKTSQYIPKNERTGAKSTVFFTRDLSANGLIKIYDTISEKLNGKIAIKLHTGEKNGPNIIPRQWVKSLCEERIPDGTVVETNTYYDGDRYTTERHREILKINGWTFCPVDILDDKGAVDLPIKGGRRMDKISVGKNLLNYDSLLCLTHFKGHVAGGIGGSNKNIGIGCADGRTGKKQIHTYEGSDNMWSIMGEEFMERITESAKGTIDYFGEKIAYINVMRNMSVSCDCEGVGAAPVVTPNIGIVASLDILSVDQASVDLVYALKESDKHDLFERFESRCGIRQLSYMKEMGMGNDLYTLIDIDNGGVEISCEDAVRDVVPFEG